ncbi:Uncharacterised protein [Mycobacteroides abscessus subsp. abscessus]|nr:hypothetical protein [Mycobacteroides abscessus]SIF67261.1 Uncharacterised protein [Mycobacteroides abscessus subsp. abscessus]SLE01281.1 Uncharacterised protein [Mycobacteroides abscessus subsp. massiliense]QOF39293.1 hypothetical protein E3G66_003462 [Mycobacteroides abscessus]SIF93523.1 Uncharacterised protein [Mycobacteroides abscessus subsp. abscessus]
MSGSYTLAISWSDEDTPGLPRYIEPVPSNQQGDNDARI